MKFNDKIIQIAEQIDTLGGTLFLVGGAIRDEILGIPSVDQDFAIQGITQEQAEKIISKFSETEIKKVVSNAPVFMARIDSQDTEFALCRMEIDTAPGKEGFQFFSNPEISIFDDLIRRDFSVNCLAQNVLTLKIVDPFNGQKDIEDRVLRHVSDAFVQSPERVLRCASFAARLDFRVSQATINIMKEMSKDFDTIPAERMWRHFEKMASKSDEPSIFVHVLDSCGWNNFFKIQSTWLELDAECPENCDKVSWTISRMIIGKSEFEREKFFDMICTPNKVRREAVEFEFWDGKKPEALVQGRDIISFVKPGKEMGILLEKCFNAQISGEIRTKEQGIDFIKRQAKI